MPRTKKPFPSGNAMPDNVYHHNKKAGHYRIKLKDGSFRSCPFTEEQEVIQLAIALLENDKTHAAPQRVVKSSLDSFWKDFEEYFYEYAKISKSSVNGFKAIKGHLDFLMEKDIKDIDFSDCTKIWNKLTYHSQKTCRTPLVTLLDFLFSMGGAKNLQMQNYFVRAKLKAAPKKKRKELTQDLFDKIKIEAKKLGYDFIVDAMNIGFLTGMRVGDVLSLTDEHIGNCLGKVLGKSMARSIPQMNSYELSLHKELNLIINKCKMKRPSGCPYIITHRYELYKESEKKNHPNQVLQDYFNDKMLETRLQIPELAILSGSQLPSFHEIRHLRVAAELQSRPFEEISKDLGHTDTKITEQFYNTHKQYEVRNVEYVPNLTGIT